MAEDKQKSVENAVIRENHLDFLQELYEKEMLTDRDSIRLLRKHGRIKEGEIPKIYKGLPKAIQTDDTVKGYMQKRADEFVDVVEGDGSDVEGVIITDTETYDKLADTHLFKYQGDKDITAQDWLPESTIRHTPEFVTWIDSMNDGFQNMAPYKPFQMYCQQASDWIAENENMGMFETRDEKREYAFEEIRKSDENTLYFLDKYLMLKEGDMSSGSRSYQGKPVHKVICFLFDAGYSSVTGKPRQIAATSTYGGCALKKIIFNKNFFLKFITMDKESGEEIFDDKIKYPFGELPEWMKPEVSNDRDNLFRLSKKMDKKGTKGGVNSKIQVVAPSVSAINGGSPQLVMIDEAGYIGILGKMMKEARPTMFWQNPDTGLIEPKRQILIWGTGGEMDKGGKAYEEEYFAILAAWQKRDFSMGIVPIFFDWTTRPGITREHYDNEKRAYTTDGPDRDERMVQFRQHYPSIIEDMFLTSAKTLVSIDWINEQLERIRDAGHKIRPTVGYFEPIYDTDSPADEHSDVPFKIIGANFIPTDDGDPRASCKMFQRPKKLWRNRYYQGTDPIMSDNGYSNMASTVFDAHYKTKAAEVNYRDSNHKYTFLQCMLLGLYYDTNNQGGIPELVESNIGTAYVDYKDTKGFYNSFVYRTQLPDHMQGGSAIVGIDNRGNRTKFIINKMFEFLMAYGTKLYIDTTFIQLRTFICTVTQSGNETWGTSDKRKYLDDILFSDTFAYICSLCFDHLPPKEIKTEEDEYVVRQPLRRDSNGELYRARVKVKTR